jgi:hypothetical protein
VDNFKESLNGLYDKALGTFMFSYLEENIEILQPYFMEEYGVDLKQKLKETE